MDISEFKALPFEDQVTLLNHHLPRGVMWVNAYDPNTNFGKLMMGLALEYYRLGLMTEELTVETDIDQTLKLISEWETSIGIPTNIFTIEGNSMEDRRKNIKYLLTNFWGVQTKDDFERVASYYGYTVFVNPGVYYGGFPLHIPAMFFSDDKTSKFTLVVYTTLAQQDYHFALPFPAPFSNAGTSFLQALFELLSPANCMVLVTNIEP